MASFDGVLNGSSRNIGNLVGMEYAVNLLELRMRNDNITSLSPIAGLTTLTVLDVAHNGVTSLSYVPSLTGMKELILTDNNFSNITPLAGMTQLEKLHLDSNNLGNVAAVAGLTNLHSLFLNDNSISNLAPVAGLTNLVTLDVGNNNVTNITPIAGLTNLTSLTLSHNSISDISAVADMTEVSSIYLDNNNLTDISAVAGLSSTITLHLEYNQIVDISPMAGLDTMKYLYLQNNQIQTVDLRNANLPSLYRANFANNPVTTVLLPRATLDQDAFNSIMNGNSSSYVGVAELNGVLDLDLSGVDFIQISDLSSMHKADDLETLSFAGAANLDGSDVAALLYELNSLDWLNVAGVWDSFDTTTRNLLVAWDALSGNTLITLPGDANGDGWVNSSDATILAGNWQASTDGSPRATWSMGDFNYDGQVDASDATILASNWQTHTVASATVPEPATLSMLLVLATMWILWKKKK
jgi:internalin A